MAELRAIDRINEEKVDRIVAVLAPMVAAEQNAKWGIGDVLVAEFPLARTRDRDASGQWVVVRDGELARYLRAIANRLDVSVATLKNYRLTAAKWPPDERVAEASWSNHHTTKDHPDRRELVRLPSRDLYRRLGYSVGSAPIRRVRRAEHAFANISKAAEATIDVLSDEDLAPEKRIKLALTILVKFFEDAAA